MNIPDCGTNEEFLYSGHSACPGCGSALMVRYLSRVFGDDAVFVITASCWSIIAAAPPLTALKRPILHCPFPSAAAVGSGVKRGLQHKGHRDAVVVVLAGDGGTFDIGMQALSAAAQRNEDFIFVCYDNEAYMNTGMQTSSATPCGSYTTTFPLPRTTERRKKDIVRIMAAHGVPYAATATVAYLDDMVEKFKKAREIRGFRFFHLLTPCPPGWGAASDDTIRLSRLAVDSCLFPLYEVRDGAVLELTYRPVQKAPLDEYFSLQRRYSGLDRSQAEALQRAVDRDWERLLHLADTDCASF